MMERAGGCGILTSVLMLSSVCATVVPPSGSAKTPPATQPKPERADRDGESGLDVPNAQARIKIANRQSRSSTSGNRARQNFPLQAS
jgi:hypothetical protein